MLTSSFNREDERLAALYALELLDTAASEDFDRICRVAVHAFNVETALVSLVDRDRQWFKARVGFEQQETPIEQSVCIHAVRTRKFFHVEDASKDPRFSANPLVLCDQGLRFYAGAPLLTRDGLALGTFCIIDSHPRSVTAEEQRLLEDMAATVMDLITARQLLRRRDPVTGLPNRQQFDSDLADLPKNTADVSRTLVLIDVLDIKTVYEMGRALGMKPFENLIRLTSQRLSQSLAEPTTLYHVGVARLAYTSSAPTEVVIQELNRIIPALRDPVYLDGTPVTPHVTAGIVPFEINPEDVSDALRKGMCAVDRALENGTLLATYDANIDARNRRRYELIAELPQALDRGDLFLEYQPRIALDTGKVRGVEALIRWHHPHAGLIRPDEFLPLLEKTSHMTMLTGWVIEEAISQLHRWGEEFAGCLSINLSPSDFEKNPAGFIVAACDRHQIDPRRIEIEITEGEWLSHSASHRQLERLREHGIQIAIDDFGSGFSNFAYLTELHADVIKLDKSLVAEITKNARRLTLVRHVVRLAKVLGYSVVAEGIEDEETFQLLCSLHCDEGQGYLFSRPLLNDELIKWIRRSASSLRAPI